MFRAVQINPRRWQPLAVASILVMVASSSWGEPCPETSERNARVDVTLDQEAGTIVVDPESIEIYFEPGPGRPNRVCWVVEGLAEGQTVLVEGKPGSEDLFPSLEREIRWPRDFANSGKPAGVGTWIYDVALLDAEGEELMRLDPEVNVEQGP